MTACPKCGSQAYVSLMGDVECSNSSCPNYSPALYPPPKAEEPKNDTKAEMSPEIDSEKTMWLWSNYHHDFGD